MLASPFEAVALDADALAAKFAANLRSKTDTNGQKLGRNQLIAQNPLVDFLRERGYELFQAGDNLITGCCPKGEHKKPGHRPVAIDVKNHVWYCNDHKVGGSIIDWKVIEKGVSVGEAMRSLNGGEQTAEKSAREFVCAYDYTDEAGNLLFQSVRYKVPPPKNKTFLQRYKDSSGKWVWNTKGVRRVLYHLPQVLEAETVIVVEGEKDADALTKLGFVATTNVGGAGKWRDEYSQTLTGKNVIVFADIGDGQKEGENHAQTVLRSLIGKAQSIKHPIQPAHDISDFIDPLPTSDRRAAVQRLIDETKDFELNGSVDVAPPPERRARLTVRTIDEILAMRFDPDDLILQNGYLTKGDLTALCGMGGIGKSRLAMQFAMCCRSGRDFIGWATNGRDLRFLFLQTENSCRRLQADLKKMLSSFTPEEQEHIRAGVVFHTLEADDDGFLMLDSENIGRVHATIERARADVVMYDPLRDFSLDDLNSDKFMGETLRSILRVTKRGNPKRTPLAIHHAVTGKAGAQKASGWDRSSFGRNSKVLQIIARAQINIAPAQGDDNSSIIIASGKCNNAKEFEPFAARLSFDTMLYSVDDSVDMERWREEVSDQKGSPSVNPKILREVLATEKDYERSEIVEILKDEPAEVHKTRAYQIIRQATASKILRFNKTTKTYKLS